MRFPRFTIAKLMLLVLVLVLGLLMGFVATFSIMGLIAFMPFVFTAMISQFAGSKLYRLNALTIAIAGTLLVPFVLAIWMNHAMWGYWFCRPPVDSRIVDASAIQRLSYITSPEIADSAVSGAPIRNLSQYVQAHPQEGDYSDLEGRVLRALMDRGHDLSRVETIKHPAQSPFIKLLRNTGRLEPGEPDYLSRTRNLSGITIEALGRDGRPLLFVAVRSWGLAGEHGVFYELLFSRDSDRVPWDLIAFQRLNFDWGELGFVVWPVLFVVFSFLSLLPTILLQAIFAPKGARRPKALPSVHASIGNSSFPAPMLSRADFLKTDELDRPS